MSETDSKMDKNVKAVNEILGDATFTNQLQANSTLLAELDPNNTLGLAGAGTMLLTLVSGTGEPGTLAFTKGVQMMLTDRTTSLGDVLNTIAPKP